MSMVGKATVLVIVVGLRGSLCPSPQGFQHQNQWAAAVRCPLMDVGLGRLVYHVFLTVDGHGRGARWIGRHPFSRGCRLEKAEG